MFANSFTENLFVHIYLSFCMRIFTKFFGAPFANSLPSLPHLISRWFTFTLFNPASPRWIQGNIFTSHSPPRQHTSKLFILFLNGVKPSQVIISLTIYKTLYLSVCKNGLQIIVCTTQLYAMAVRLWWLGENERFLGLQSTTLLTLDQSNSQNPGICLGWEQRSVIHLIHWFTIHLKTVCLIFHGLLEMLDALSVDWQCEAERLLAPSGEFLHCDEFAIRQTYQPSCLLLSSEWVVVGTNILLV